MGFPSVTSMTLSGVVVRYDHSGYIAPYNAKISQDKPILSATKMWRNDSDYVYIAHGVILGVGPKLVH